MPLVPLKKSKPRCVALPQLACLPFGGVMHNT
jgi:hypothetical protein